MTITDTERKEAGMTRFEFNRLLSMAPSTEIRHEEEVLVLRKQWTGFI